MDKSNYLFVYGTLKRGLGNSYFLRNSEFIGKATSEERFDVYDVGFPCAYPNENGKIIIGEVYKLTDEDFIFTDSLESNGRLYQRYIQNFAFYNKPGGCKAWIYIIINPMGRLYQTNNEFINWK